MTPASAKASIRNGELELAISDTTLLSAEMSYAV